MPPMILAIDTSTAACTAALFAADGECIARRDELIGRGHAERLMPMLADMLEGRRAERILVGAGPGSFTGIRVGVSAAHGLAIGWHAELTGMSSLALLALGARTKGKVAVAIRGGHGELFVQQFDAGEQLRATTPLLNLPALEAGRRFDAPLVVGTGATDLVEARGSGEARDGWPAAADALRLPADLRTLPPKPLYARAPDARAKVAA